MMMALVSGCDRQDAGTSADQRPASVSQSAAPSPPDSTAPPWVIDPSDPGANLPPVGRSLFDFLITKDVNGKKIYDIPFPFSSLVARIESRLHSERTQSVLKRLLIPVNRSLQRRAGDGAFFVYPRAVLAVDTDADSALSLSGMYLKDRLFIGYHEKTGVLEVISYNEAAGRFEFQVVSDYRSGGTPTVRYANRALCIACHQNHSPIFSRPMWDETNVNPKIAALLAHQHRPYHGFPIRQGVSVLQAFDDATDRANDISLVQLLWREGCEQAGRPELSIRCRAELIEWMLQYALLKRLVQGWHTGEAGVEPPSFLAAWRARWPHGLAIPNPDIPNRNPFRYVAVSEFPGLSEVEATALEGREPRSLFRGPHEPTLPRDPLEVWTVPDTPEALERILASFVQFFTKADLNRLERLIRQQPERFHQALSALAQKTFMGQTDVFANQTFRRVTFLTALDEQLGTPVITRCCLDNRGMPPPVDEVVESHHSTDGEKREVPPAGMLKIFHEYCGACHHGTDGFPPNFLHGSPDEVETNLAQCADRMFVRLSMWNVADREQLEAPMPPAMHVLQHRIGLDQWTAHPDFQALRREAAAAVRRKRGSAFTPEDLLRQDYDTLPACIAPGKPTQTLARASRE
ncbi:MAG: hypothetical protein OJF51_003867 [Nitrospira sp.]|jgi:hypothetical protein|nr:MAG: hypothetical protein OJF51_003867 [Nitrospira sp.]